MPAGFGLSPQLGAVPKGSRPQQQFQQPQQQPQETLPSQPQQTVPPQGMLNWEQYNAWQRQQQQSYQQG
eukprot:3446656-Karenia_brevis.AAC.1